MASFCGKCGFNLGGASAFCPNCGSPAGNRPNSAAASQPSHFVPPVVPPIPAAAGSSSALKIVIVLLCCLMVGGVAIVGGLFYAAHRVKQAVIQRASESGVDLNSITSASPSTRTLPKPCDVLTKEEISNLIGEPIERAEPKDASCNYYGPAGLTAKLAQTQASDTMKRAQAPDSKTDGMEVANSMTQLVQSLGAQTGLSDGAEQPLVMLILDADGQAQMNAINVNKAIFGGIARGSVEPGQKALSFGSDIPGLGDKAVRFPKLGLNVLKDGVLIRIIPGPIPEADAKTIAIARAVLPKI